MSHPSSFVTVKKEIQPDSDMEIIEDQITILEIQKSINKPDCLEERSNWYEEIREEKEPTIKPLLMVEPESGYGSDIEFSQDETLAAALLASNKNPSLKRVLERDDSVHQEKRPKKKRRQYQAIEEVEKSEKVSKGKKDLKKKKRKREDEGDTNSRPSKKMAKSENKKEKRYICGIDGCDQVFEFPSRLTKHQRTHTGEKPFICNFDGCKSAFAQISNLTRHQRIHTGHKLHECDFDGCDKAFTSSAQLVVHKRTHTQVRSLMHVISMVVTKHL